MPFRETVHLRAPESVKNNQIKLPATNKTYNNIILSDKTVDIVKFMNWFNEFNVIGAEPCNKFKFTQKSLKNIHKNFIRNLSKIRWANSGNTMNKSFNVKAASE